MLHALKFQYSENAVKGWSRVKPLTFVAFDLIVYLLQQSIKAIFLEI